MTWMPSWLKLWSTREHAEKDKDECSKGIEGECVFRRSPGAQAPAESPAASRNGNACAEQSAAESERRPQGDKEKFECAALSHGVRSHSEDQ